MAKSSFKVLAWPRRSPSNVYTGSLNDALARIPGVEVKGLAYGIKPLIRAALRPADVLHVHWPERAFWAPTRREALRQAAYVAVLTLILKARGAKLIWTAHDPEPHRSPLNRWLTDRWTGGFWRRYIAMILTRIDGILMMSESHRPAIAGRSARLGAVPSAITLHPHYLGQYPDVLDRATARAKLGIAADVPVVAFVGSLRVYKNPDGLITAFRQLSSDAVLLIAGSSETPDHAARLRDLAAGDDRIRLHDAFVPDEELQLWLRAADFSVLPYRKVTNSGSAHLALSFDLPVLVPDEPVFRELEGLVGTDWVRRFSGDISAEHIAEGIAWVRQPRPVHPDLSQLDWDAIAGQTLAFFRQVKGR